jgi:hypothetical protein
MEQFFNLREEWLTAGMDGMRSRITAAGYSLPEKLKVTCGFPIGSRGGKKIMGQCISPKASAGGVTEMSVSPMISDPITALGVLLHELGHAACGVEAGHGRPFKAFCAALGLEGKATEAMPGAACRQWLQDEVLPLLGAYPHDAVDPSTRKKQGTRMIKLVCPETGYTVRTTKKWLARGVPTSPAGCEMVVEAEGNEDE